MATESKASWVTAKPEEVKSKIVELAKSGLTPEKIGLVMRDQHGIPRAKSLGLKVSSVLKEAKIPIASEYVQLEEKLKVLKSHSEKNKHDYKAKRSFQKTTSHINSLKKKN